MKDKESNNIRLSQKTKYFVHFLCCQNFPSKKILRSLKRMNNEILRILLIKYAPLMITFVLSIFFQEQNRTFFPRTESSIFKTVLQKR